MFQGYLQYYLKKTVWIAVHCLLLLILIRFFVGEAGRINGASMEPTLHDKQLFWVNKVSYLVHAPRRFDIAQLFNPAQPSELLVKRIVGLPGDTLTWSAAQLSITTANEEQFQIDLLSNVQANTAAAQTVTLPAHTYFVLGDHYETSADSRLFGPVHRRWINGKVLSL